MNAIRLKTEKPAAGWGRVEKVGPLSRGGVGGYAPGISDGASDMLIEGVKVCLSTQIRLGRSNIASDVMPHHSRLRPTSATLPVDLCSTFYFSSSASNDLWRYRQRSYAASILPGRKQRP